MKLFLRLIEAKLFLAVAYVTWLCMLDLLGSISPPDYSLVDGPYKYASKDEGRVDRLLNPGWGWCLRCGEIKHGYFDRHWVNHCSPACLDCWTEASLQERHLLADALTRAWSSTDGSLCGDYDANVEIADEYKERLAETHKAIDREQARDDAMRGLSRAERATRLQQRQRQEMIDEFHKNFEVNREGNTINIVSRVKEDSG